MQRTKLRPNVNPPLAGATSSMFKAHPSNLSAECSTFEQIGTGDVKMFPVTRKNNEDFKQVFKVDKKQVPAGSQLAKEIESHFAKEKTVTPGLGTDTVGDIDKCVILKTEGGYMLIIDTNQDGNYNSGEKIMMYNDKGELVGTKEGKGSTSIVVDKPQSFSNMNDLLGQLEEKYM